MPVVDTTTSGTLGALNATVTRDVSPYYGVAFYIGSGLTGTVDFQGTLDGTNWFPLAVVSYASTTTTTAVIQVVNPTGTAAYLVETGRGMGLKQVRMKVSAYTSGTCTGIIYPISK